MRHTVRTHVLIRLHPCLQQPPSCQDRTLLSAYLPSAPTWVTRLLSLQKQNITEREAPFCSRSTSQQFVWGQRLPPSWCSTPIMPSGAFGILTGASYFFHNESSVLLWVPCATHGCLCHTHIEAAELHILFQTCKRRVYPPYLPLYTARTALNLWQNGTLSSKEQGSQRQYQQPKTWSSLFLYLTKNALKAVINV